MFLNNLFSQASVTPPQAFDREDAPAPSSQRSGRMTKLVSTMRRERDAAAARAAKQDQMIEALQQTVAQYERQEPSDGRSRQTLQQDLDVALQMLDEFEADAMRARGAIEEIDDLRAQARVHESIIAELEDELAQWRCPALSAA